MSEEQNSEKNTESLTLGQTVTIFTLGAVVGAGLDALIPTESDGSLVNTVVDAFTGGLVWSLADKFISKKPTMYAVNSGGVLALGSAVGQTLYHLLKTYS